MQKKRNKSNRQWVDKEGYLLCKHCGKPDYIHFETEDDGKGGLVRKRDEFGSIFRTPCQEAIEKQFQDYYSEKIKHCKITGPPETRLSELITVKDAGGLEPLPNALILGELPTFQAHFKTFLRKLYNGRRQLQFNYLDTVHIPRMRDIKFGKDPEFTTFDQFDKFDLLIIDLGIIAYENVSDGPNIMELLGIRRYLATWFIAPVANRHNLSKNIPNDLQGHIKTFPTITLEPGKKEAKKVIIAESVAEEVDEVDEDPPPEKPKKKPGQSKAERDAEKLHARKQNSTKTAKDAKKELTELLDVSGIQKN